MRETPAGDVENERGERHFCAVRQSEPRFAAPIREVLGESKTLINVGAGAGSYEPTTMEVTLVTPSAAMRAQRPATLQPAVDATAEALPFPDQCFDSALASVAVHQWRDLERGLSELRRVTRGPVVIMTFDPSALRNFWLKDYASRLMEHEAGRMREISGLVDLLGGTSEVEVLPTAFNGRDGFAEAYFGRPEAFLEPHVRASQSAWGFLSEEEIDRAIKQLRRDLDEGTWEATFGELRHLPQYVGALRLIVKHPTTS